MSNITAARYGKDNVRILKRRRDEASKTEFVTEMTVQVLLEGQIETSYTKADNSVVVPTDTVKNTIAILAKQNPVDPPELFASIMAFHFPSQYSHIQAAHVKITIHRWSRMTIDDVPHPHSFLRDGSDTRNVEVSYQRGGGFCIQSAIQGLLVLKSTGSAFHGFHKCEYTTLKESSDRILSTEVDAVWKWRPFNDLADVQAHLPMFNKTYDTARSITVDTFAKDNSASVQATMYKMADQILSASEQVQDVSYSLPNKHYFEIDLSWHKGIKNTGKDAEVYAPQSDPNGLIKCTVGRPKSSRL